MDFKRRLAYAVLLTATSGLHFADRTSADEKPVDKPTVQIEFKHDGGQKSTQGEVLVDYPDGSLLLLTPDGQLWTLQPEDIVSSEPLEEKMKVLTSEEI